MDKTLEFLEEYCQWLAVGLGGLFLGWMLWSYVLMSPVTVAGSGGTDLHPGNVDDVVHTTAAEPVETLLRDNAPVQPPAQSGADPVEPFIRTVKGDEPQTGKPIEFASLPPTLINSPPSEVKVGSGVEEMNMRKDPVTALPTVPPSEVTEALAKRAYVGPAPLPAGATPPPAAPPVAAATPDAPPALPPGHDLSYVRVSYNIPSEKIADAFLSVKVPAGGTTTGVVAVKLMRQERDANGKWGTAVEVPLPKTNIHIESLPPEGAGLGTFNAFRAWSDSGDGQAALLRPYFYPIVFGEGPWDPSMDDQMPVFDADADRRAKQLKYKEEQDKRKAAAGSRAPSRTPTRPPTGGRPPRGGGGDMPAVGDPQRPAEAGGMIGVQYPGGTPRQNVPFGRTPTPTPGQPDATPTAPPVVVAPGAGLPPATPLPAPSFSPFGTPAFLCWAYDETVVEGHTYRYQVLYALRSPVYASNITKPPALADVFALWSTLDENAWGPDVEVKPTAEYFLAATNWTADRTPSGLKVDVFKWANGKWQMSQFTVAPGDQIGDVEKDGINYATNTTVVDLRYDPRGNGGQGRPYVLLLTADGRLVEREPTADRNNVRMNQLKGVIAAGQNTVPGQAPPVGMGGQYNGNSTPPNMGGNVGNMPTMPPGNTAP